MYVYVYIYIYTYIHIIIYRQIYIFKESVSGEYHMYQLIPLHSCDYLQKTSIK